MRVEAKQQRDGGVPDFGQFSTHVAVCAIAHRRPIQTVAFCVLPARQMKRVTHLVFTSSIKKDHHYAN